MVMQQRTILGRYSLGEPIGSGGMGTVYEGYDQVLGRPVAIKSLHEQFSADTAVLERFKREAKIAAPLSHRGIAQVYDFAVENGSSYIVMELLDGKDLHHLLAEQGALPPEQAIALVAEAADAVSHAHAAGVVHRDLKPGNIFLTTDGHVKVTDFGIAWSSAHAHMTGTKEMIGTPLYLSPQQVSGERATASSDIYALGCVLFQLVTGTPPYEGDTPVAIALAHRHQSVPSASSIAPQVSAGLDAVISKAMQKDPSARFATASEMAAALRGLMKEPAGQPTQIIDLTEAPTIATLPSPSLGATTPTHQRVARRPDKAWIAVGILVLLIASLVLLANQQRSAARLVDVPRLVGLDLTNARSKAAAVDLQISASNTPSDLPRGTVVGQQPAAGTPIGRGATISVRVSLGPTVAVPIVVGEPLGSARSVLEDAGFLVVVNGEADASSIVVGQQPSGGTLARESTVTLTVQSTARHGKGKEKD